MQRPLQLRWHHIEPSEALEALVREETSRLERFWDRIVGCSVAIEAPSRHHRQSGAKYRVRIELSVPGAKLVVGRDPPRTSAHADAYAAVNEAFREMRRQLEDHVRQVEARVREPETRAVAEVARLLPEEGYGFLRTREGREIYFHERSVLGGAFHRLRVGDVVRFVEEAGEEGPQASTVAPPHGRRTRHRAAAKERRRAP